MYVLAQMMFIKVQTRKKFLRWIEQLKKRNGL